MREESVIVRQISGFYDVLHNNVVIQCKARGLFRKENISPMVGDKVVIDISEKVITSILPRKNQFNRPLVSNIDHLGIVIAAKDPLPDHYLIDKLILNASINDVNPFLIINKSDLATKEESSRIVDEYSCSGFPIFITSCKEHKGIDELKKSFSIGVVALAGQSGVGKSSLLNRICTDVSLRVGELSTRTATGKHTTTHAQIIPLTSGAMLVDTPGFSSIEANYLTPLLLQNYYSEFVPYMGQCRFLDCLHVYEPDCAIKDAVDKGLLTSGRYERYKAILVALQDEKGRNFK